MNDRIQGNVRVQVPRSFHAFKPPFKTPNGDIHLFDAYREGIAARVAQIVPAPVTVPAAVPAR